MVVIIVFLKPGISSPLLLPSKLFLILSVVLSLILSDGEKMESALSMLKSTILRRKLVTWKALMLIL